MKKVLLLLLLLGMLVSCVANKVVIKDYGEQMKLLKTNFPEIYEQYRNGKIIINQVYEYTDKKTGVPRVHVNYRHVGEYY